MRRNSTTGPARPSRSDGARRRRSGAPRREGKGLPAAFGPHARAPARRRARRRCRSMKTTRAVGRIPVRDVRPSVDCGRRPAKAVVGETFEVTATVFREGHDAVAANVVL
ncbi:maltotransferase domain-containing protein, partial [Streptomyces viridosporus]|uniref:maltotransferase domain-containing protein n=1 Tax=Streptomyces viridosporus TaxID=67581 RepID=UPI003D9F2860